MEINKGTAMTVIVTNQKAVIQFLLYVEHCAGHGEG